MKKLLTIFTMLIFIFNSYGGDEPLRSALKKQKDIEKEITKEQKLREGRLSNIKKRTDNKVIEEQLQLDLALIKESDKRLDKLVSDLEKNLSFSRARMANVEKEKLLKIDSKKNPKSFGRSFNNALSYIQDQEIGDHAKIAKLKVQYKFKDHKKLFEAYDKKIASNDKIDQKMFDRESKRIQKEISLKDKEIANEEAKIKKYESRKEWLNEKIDYYSDLASIFRNKKDALGNIPTDQHRFMVDAILDASVYPTLIKYSGKLDDFNAYHRILSRVKSFINKKLDQKIVDSKVSRVINFGEKSVYEDDKKIAEDKRTNDLAIIESNKKKKNSLKMKEIGRISENNMIGSIISLNESKAIADQEKLNQLKKSEGLLRRLKERYLGRGLRAYDLTEQNGQVTSAESATSEQMKSLALSRQQGIKVQRTQSMPRISLEDIAIAREKMEAKKEGHLIMVKTQRTQSMPNMLKSSFAGPQKMMKATENEKSCQKVSRNPLSKFLASVRGFFRKKPSFKENQMRFKEECIPAFKKWLDQHKDHVGILRESASKTIQNSLATKFIKGEQCQDIIEEANKMDSTETLVPGFFKTLLKEGIVISNQQRRNFSDYLLENDIQKKPLIDESLKNNILDPLIEIFSIIAKNSDKNKMTLNNIVIATGSNLFEPSDEEMTISMSKLSARQESLNAYLNKAIISLDKDNKSSQDQIQITLQ